MVLLECIKTIQEDYGPLKISQITLWPLAHAT